MSVLPQLLHNTVAVSGCVGLLYAGSLFVAVLVSVFARSRARRKDARTTLSILVRRRSR